MRACARHQAERCAYLSLCSERLAQVSEHVRMYAEPSQIYLAVARMLYYRGSAVRMLPRILMLGFTMSIEPC